MVNSVKTLVGLTILGGSLFFGNTSWAVWSETCGIVLEQIADPTKRLEALVRRIIREGNRERYASVYTEASGDHSWVRVESPIGTYIFELGTEDSELINAPATLERVDGKNVAFVRFPGPDKINFNGIENVIRTAFRADPYLHSQQKIPGQPPQMKPSIEQQEALAALLRFESEARPGEALKVGIVTSTGVGKTFLSTEYTKLIGHKLHNDSDPKVARAWTKPPKVLFVVENNDVLSRSMHTFRDQLDYDRITEVFDGRTKGAIPQSSQLVGITRSGLFSRLAEIESLLTQDPTQPWVIVMDEAHHTGN